MKDWPKKLEIATNVAVLVTCCFFFVVIAINLRARFATPHPTRSNASVLVGKALNLPRTDWGASQNTVVLVASTQCHFCIASTPFYAKLSHIANSEKVPFIAVFPQSADESTSFLTQHQISVTSLRQMQLATLGVDATPTLFIVDSKGKIVRSWVGQLNDSGQSEVFSLVQHEPAIPASGT